MWGGGGGWGSINGDGVTALHRAALRTTRLLPCVVGTSDTQVGVIHNIDGIQA